MSARVRKLIGSVGILIFVIAYAVAAMLVAEHLPESRIIDLIYFVVVGVAWGVPIIPLISWMNREP